MSMYFELHDIFIFAVLISIILYWISAQKIRELALNAARSACEKLNLQLLDGSVSLKKILPSRRESGSLALKREYLFEFSATGDERYQGKITVLGKQIVDVYLPPHRMV